MWRDARAQSRRRVKRAAGETGGVVKEMVSDRCSVENDKNQTLQRLARSGGPEEPKCSGLAGNTDASAREVTEYAGGSSPSGRRAGRATRHAADARGTGTTKPKVSEALERLQRDGAAKCDVDAPGVDWLPCSTSNKRPSAPEQLLWLPGTSLGAHYAALLHYSARSGLGRQRWHMAAVCLSAAANGRSVGRIHSPSQRHAACSHFPSTIRSMHCPSLARQRPSS